jgi:nucleoside-diphosphate-sugar epimerase
MARGFTRLLADYSCLGILEGASYRLPTSCVRPGKPNRAASGFFSSIIREPLAGEEAVLPVDDNVQHWFASPRAAIGFALHSAALAYAALGSRPNLVMPGVSATVGEQIDALRRIAGDKVANRIVRVRDSGIATIIGGWPQSFTAERAVMLGFRTDPDFDAIVKAHINNERGGMFVA